MRWYLVEILYMGGSAAMTIPAALIGAPIEEIDTPALLLDLDIMERNIARMAAAFQPLQAKLRPHAKTHKSPIIARKQLAAGAIGVTCAKLGEAEVMIEGGVRDVLIANQIVGVQKIRRLVSLAHHADLIVAVDDSRNITALSQAAQAANVTLLVLVEVNIGQNRCGVEPGEPALTLARQVEQAPRLKFAGLMGYEGHLVFVPSLEERVHRVHSDMQALTDTVSFIESGLRVELSARVEPAAHYRSARVLLRFKLARMYLWTDATNN
jgi:D-serine deaminase-like pyridoxal phosphate-dependent protein